MKLSRLDRTFYFSQNCCKQVFAKGTFVWILGMEFGCIGQVFMFGLTSLPK